MGALTVLDPGMMTTVQDLGRPGLASIGVPEGGAADPLALRVGNRLLGNPDGAAGLEMTMLGGTFAFEGDGAIALAGGEARAVLESSDDAGVLPAPWCTPINIRAGARLRIAPIVRGVRAYLCIRGGVRVQPALGSSSTLLSARFGGLDGRALRNGDRLEWNEVHANRPIMSPAVARVMLDEVLVRRSLRAVAGSHASEFADAETSAFWDSTFTVSQRSDRIGVRLAGHVGSAAKAVGTGRMASEGMMCGAVQIPPGGEPIVLLVDHPTTGGYPVIACVATVDLPALGQLRPGDRVGFERITQASALALLHDRERRLAGEAAA